MKIPSVWQFICILVRNTSVLGGKILHKFDEKKVEGHLLEGGRLLQKYGRHLLQLKIKEDLDRLNHIHFYLRKL